MNRRLAAVTMTPARVAEMMGFPAGTSLLHVQLDPVADRAYLVFDGPQFDEVPSGAQPDIGVLLTSGDQTAQIVDIQMAGGLQILAEHGMEGDDAITAFRAWRSGKAGPDTARVTAILGEPR